MKSLYVPLQKPLLDQVPQCLEFICGLHFGVIVQPPQDFLQFVFTQDETDTLQSLSLAKVGQSVYLSVHAEKKPIIRYSNKNTWYMEQVHSECDNTIGF